MPCMALGRFFYDHLAAFPNAAEQRKRSLAWRLARADVAMQPPVPPLPWTPAIGETLSVRTTSAGELAHRPHVGDS